MLQKNITNYNEIDVSHVYEYWKATFDFTSMVDASPYDMLKLFAPMGEAVCELEIGSPQVQALIK